MHHAPNSLGCFTAEDWFSTVEANHRGNLLHLHGFALDIEDLADQLLTALCFPAHMTPKHSYLRLA